MGVFKRLLKLASDNSTTIMTCIGVGSLSTAPVLAVKATVTALGLIEDEVKEEYPGYKYDVLHSPFLLGKRKTVKTVWKCYVPTAIVIIGGSICIVASNSINLKRNAALASMYTLAETTLKQYQSKVVEVVGENKAQKIRDEVYTEKLRQNPVKEDEIIPTGHGDMLCYEVTSGRYFRSDIEYIRKCQNELNESLLTSDYIPLNDLYDCLGLCNTTLGWDFGWMPMDGLIKIKFSSQLTSKGTPCLVVDSDPQYTKDIFH